MINIKLKFATFAALLAAAGDSSGFYNLRGATNVDSVSLVENNYKNYVFKFSDTVSETDFLTACDPNHNKTKVDDIYLVKVQ